MYVGFRTDKFALDNPFGDSALGKANFPSLSLLAAFNSSSMGVILWGYPFHMSMFIDIVISLILSRQPFQRQTVFQQTSRSSGSYIFLLPLLPCSLNHRYRSCDVDVLFGSELHTIYWSLHWAQLTFCDGLYLLYKETSLMRVVSVV